LLEKNEEASAFSGTWSNPRNLYDSWLHKQAIAKTGSENSNASFELTYNLYRKLTTEATAEANAGLGDGWGLSMESKAATSEEFELVRLRKAYCLPGL